MDWFVNRNTLAGFVVRVTLAHVVTYVLCGVFFLSVLGQYTEVYADPAVSAYQRPTDDPLLTLAPLLQFVRGPILALCLWAFRDAWVQNPRGWLVLFGVLAGLQVLAAPGGLLEDLLYTKLPLGYHLTNVPEVLLQLLLFSVWAWGWERRAAA
jgi:hypothetical protein